MRTEGISPKTARTTANNAMTTSVVKKIGNTSTTDNNRACSDRGSKEDRGGNGMLSVEDRVCSKEPICHRCK